MVKKFMIAVFIVFISVLWIGSLAQAADFKIIVNTSNPASSMEKGKISKLFLKKVSKWDDGGGVSPVDLEVSSDTRESFSKDVHGKSPRQIKNYWQQQLFSGKAAPPPEKASDDEVISFVKANTGAIGYVSAGASVEGVKVLSIE